MKSFEVTGHEVLRYYVSLQCVGSPTLGMQSPVDELNHRTGRLYDRQTWLEIIEPYYLKLIDPAAANTNANL